MAYTNYGEVRQLFKTLTRVWEAGGKTTLQPSSWAVLPTLALELQKCRWGVLDQAMVPSTTFNNTSGAPDDTDRLPEPVTNCVELLGSSSMERNSSQLLLKLKIVTQTL